MFFVLNAISGYFEESGTLPPGGYFWEWEDLESLPPL
jgi:hypothetical protein